MIQNIIVTEKPEVLGLELENARVISAKDYLTSLEFSQLRSARIFNLCRSYRYQSQGYYVSLLAEARRHKVLPGVMGIQDLKSNQMIKVLSSEIEELIQKKLKKLKSNEFVLSIFFGQNMTESYNELSQKLFSYVKAPLMRAEFVKTSEWSLKSLRTISFSEIAPNHLDFLKESALTYFSKRDRGPKKLRNYIYDVAILHDPDEKAPPSNQRALDLFVKAAKKLDMRAELITKNDASRLLEFDALFIRETTNVHHHTYRMARVAQAEGLVVLDDPESILRCTNKVFLEEVLERNEIPRPKTIIFGKENIDGVLNKIGLPCIIKKPDSAFSQGVYKAKTEEEFNRLSQELLTRSELLIVQEYMPSEFDWRIGILDGKPLYACKYYMVKGHWQIINSNKKGELVDGESDTLDIKSVPENVLDLAIKSSKVMGNGLYGVDLKQSGDQVYLIEVNDNPSIDAGVEDKLLKEDLYTSVMDYFLKKLHEKRMLPL